MSAQALARQMEETNEAVLELVRRATPQQWQARCPEEGWTVAATAMHVAGGHAYIAGLAQLLATGQPLPAFTMDDVNAQNAQASQQNAACDCEPVMELLRDNGTIAAELVRGLSDEQLDRSGSFFGQPITTRQFIETMLIGHVIGHTQSIRAGMGR